jgi:hypothetical protein
MSAIGTDIDLRGLNVCFGGKADIALPAGMSANDPKRTSGLAFSSTTMTEPNS